MKTLLKLKLGQKQDYCVTKNKEEEEETHKKIEEEVIFLYFFFTRDNLNCLSETTWKDLFLSVVS